MIGARSHYTAARGIILLKRAPRRDPFDAVDKNASRALTLAAKRVTHDIERAIVLETMAKAQSDREAS